MASWQRDGTAAGRDARRVDLVRRRRDRPRCEGSRSDPSAPSNLHRQPERLHAGSFRYDGDLGVAARRGGGRRDAHQGLSVGALAGHPRYSRLDPERHHHALHGRALHLLPDGGRSEGAAGAPLPSSAGATKARPVRMGHGHPEGRRLSVLPVGVANAKEIRFPLDPGKQLVLTPGQRTTTARIDTGRVREVNADVASACHRFRVSRPRNTDEARAPELTGAPPVIRFNSGPLYSIEGERFEGEVIHTWVPRRQPRS
jgi:hypothetical protein